MRKKLFSVGVILLTAVCSVTLALACGDKFLVSSRGTRYQRAPIPRDPAVILIYANPASEITKALAGVPVDATLRKAGYRPTMVESSADLDRALSHGGWDLVVAGLGDAQALNQRSKTLGVLPVILNATSAELKETRKVFPVILRAPAKSQTLLDAVDDALASRAKSRQKAVKAAS
jgi:hypothetical protein